MLQEEFSPAKAIEAVESTAFAILRSLLPSKTHARVDSKTCTNKILFDMKDESVYK
jgi:hypothetical protein